MGPNKALSCLKISAWKLSEKVQRGSKPPPLNPQRCLDPPALFRSCLCMIARCVRAVAWMGTGVIGTSGAGCLDGAGGIDERPEGSCTTARAVTRAHGTLLARSLDAILSGESSGSKPAHDRWFHPSPCASWQLAGRWKHSGSPLTWLLVASQPRCSWPAYPASPAPVTRAAAALLPARTAA